MSENARKLDAVGLFCPEPVFRTKIEMEQMQVGEKLLVLADDPQPRMTYPVGLLKAVMNCSAWKKKMAE